MRFTRGDVRDYIVSSKSITDLRSGAKERRSRREAQRSTFARFFGLFDFRLLQQNLPIVSLWGRPVLARSGSSVLMDCQNSAGSLGGPPSHHSDSLRTS